MKLNALFNKAVTRSVLALTVLAFVTPTFAAPKKGVPKKGGQILKEMTAIRTLKDVEALKPGDTVAMACSKCQTIWVSQVKKNAKGAEIQKAGGKKPTQLVGKHQCPGCKSEITVQGVGKGKERVIKHTCKSCGDKSAFCCATKAGAGATKGMDKKKK